MSRLCPCEQFGGVIPALVAVSKPCKHPGELFEPIVTRDLPDGRNRTVTAHDEVRPCVRCDLGKVCHAKDLAISREFSKLATHGECCCPSNTGVDLIEGDYRGVRAASGQTEGEHQPAQLST